MKESASSTASSIHVNIDSPSGFHMRPAAKLVQIASQYRSDIILECNDRRANGKSLLDIIMIGIAPRTGFTVSAYGDDAQPAINAIDDFFKRFSVDEAASEMIIAE